MNILKKSDNILKVLQSDRLLLTEESISMIEKDLYNLLTEYFDLSALPKLKILPEKENYKIIVEADCDRLKSFGKI